MIPIQSKLKAKHLYDEFIIMRQEKNLIALDSDEAKSRFEILDNECHKKWNEYQELVWSMCKLPRSELLNLKALGYPS